MFGISAELVKDTDAVGLRCGFDESGEDESEGCFVVDDIETEPVVGSADRIDEQE